MGPQEFVMISKAFSDGVSLQKDGPHLTKEYTSEGVWYGGYSYITAATFIPKLVAKHFVTTLIVDDELTYYESIAFERRTVMQKFSETIHIFPKDKLNKYSTHILYEPDTTKRQYVAGIELLPAQKFIVTQEESSDVDATDYIEKIGMNGDINDCEIICGDKLI